MEGLTGCCLTLFLMSMHLTCAKGAHEKNQIITTFPGKMEKYFPLEVESLARKLSKRQIILPAIQPSLNLQNIFGNMCGLMLCCSGSCCCGNSYDYYDYDYYGSINGGTAILPYWPF